VKNTLVIIPARGGSKRIPGKNLKSLGGKPLIDYSIEIALQLFPKENICLSSDDDAIIERGKKLGLDVPYKRPPELAEDHTNMVDALLHAVDFYEKRKINYEKILLLQPTSPFRKKSFIRDVVNDFSTDVDLIASVYVTKSNPYYVLFEEDKNGFLKKSKGEKFYGRAQDVPLVYELNGSLFVININTLKHTPCTSVLEFPRVKKYRMEAFYSVDLDTEIDWEFAEFLLHKKLISFGNE
jgi:CMP-N,N'-diacetyllegionaminic acid synthase